MEGTKRGHVFGLNTTDLWYLLLPHVYEQGVDGSVEMREKSIGTIEEKNANMS